MNGKSLKDKTVKGVGWSAADAFLGQGITFVVGIVLARLLSPAEYGLIGICLIFTTILNGLVDSGLSNALIRKTNVTEEDYNTMFISNLVISIVIYIFLYICSPFIAIFFEDDRLTVIIRIVGTLLILNALSIIQVTLLTKRLDFKTKTNASLISGIISGVLGIVMALLGYGVWALVVQLISKQIAYCICLWSMNKWIPDFCFNRDSFSYMWSFGWKIMAGGLIDRIWSQLYQMTVGKFYSPTTLGQYTRAKEYSSICSVNLTTIIQRVSYPVLSEIQDDKEKMMAIYRRLIKLTMLLTFFPMLLMGGVSEPLIYCLVGSQWHEAATYLPLICLSTSLYPLHAINLNMLQVLGRSDLFLGLEFIKKPIAIIPICVGIYVDIYWMLVCTVIVGLISFYLNSYYTGKKLGYSFIMQSKDIAPGFIISVIISIGVHFLQYIPVSYLIILPSQLLIAIVCFFAICEYVNLSEYMEIKGIVLKEIKKVINRTC